MEISVLQVTGIQGVGKQAGNWVAAAAFSGQDAVKTTGPCQQHNQSQCCLVFLQDSIAP